MTLQDVRDKLEWEGGFEYLYGGSEFRELEDAEFHKLRKAFVKAWAELEVYLYGDEEDEDDGA